MIAIPNNTKAEDENQIAMISYNLAKHILTKSMADRYFPPQSCEVKQNDPAWFENPYINLKLWLFKKGVKIFERQLPSYYVDVNFISEDITAFEFSCIPKWMSPKDNFVVCYIPDENEMFFPFIPKNLSSFDPEYNNEYLSFDKDKYFVLMIPKIELYEIRHKFCYQFSEIYRADMDNKVVSEQEISDEAMKISKLIRDIKKSVFKSI